MVNEDFFRLFGAALERKLLCVLSPGRSFFNGLSRISQT